jgi:hypothetical protein
MLYVMASNLVEVLEQYFDAMMFKEVEPEKHLQTLTEGLKSLGNSNYNIVSPARSKLMEALYLRRRRPRKLMNLTCFVRIKAKNV